MSAARAVGVLEGALPARAHGPPHTNWRPLDDVVEGLARSTLLETGARVVVGHSKRTSLQSVYQDLTRTRSYPYGDSAVDFFEKGDGPW